MLADIRFLNSGHAAGAAAIDLNARSQDFLPSLGEPFLRALYGQILGTNLGWGHGIFLVSGEMTGFVIGSANTKELFHRLSPLRNSGIRAAAARSLIRRPTAILRMVESLFYTSKEAVEGIPAELIVMGVKEGARGLGCGKRLVAALAREFHRKGISKYKVTVKSRNESAVGFYTRTGFETVSRFHLYGEEWHVMVAEVDRQIQAAAEG